MKNIFFHNPFSGSGKLPAVAGNIDCANYFFNKAMRLPRIQNELRNQYGLYNSKAEHSQNLFPDKKIGLLESTPAIALQTQ